MAYNLRLTQFFDAMQKELDNNSHKPGWQNETCGLLLRRASQELAELRRAVKNNRPLPVILSEAADVANFVFMVADNYEPGAK